MASVSDSDKALSLAETGFKVIVVIFIMFFSGAKLENFGRNRKLVLSRSCLNFKF
jgi:hypothetical protein